MPQRAMNEQQKVRYERLKLRYRQALASNDLSKATLIYNDIDRILRPLGQGAKAKYLRLLMHEAQIRVNDLLPAIQGLESIISSTNQNTRVYLEATTLLAIARLRQSDLSAAEPLMAYVLGKDRSIKSESERLKFRYAVVARFNEEVALASLRDVGSDVLDPKEIQDEAGVLLYQGLGDEIFTKLGNSLPRHTLNQILKVDRMSNNYLDHDQKMLLPAPGDELDRKEAGKTVFSGMKEVLNSALCDKESDIYKAWCANGVDNVLSKKYLGSAIAVTMAGWGIGIKALAVSLAALILKFGLEVYCTTYGLKAIADIRKES